jgi:hypothetical protein
MRFRLVDTCVPTETFFRKTTDKALTEWFVASAQLLCLFQNMKGIILQSLALST